MWKYTVQVSGMQCSMCEAHVNDSLRKAFPLEKVTSSHKKQETVLVSKDKLDKALMKSVITGLGYDVGQINEEPYEKKKFRLFG